MSGLWTCLWYTDINHLKAFSSSKKSQTWRLEKIGVNNTDWDVETYLRWQRIIVATKRMAKCLTQFFVNKKLLLCPTICLSSTMSFLQKCFLMMRDSLPCFRIFNQRKLKLFVFVVGGYFLSIYFHGVSMIDGRKRAQQDWSLNQTREQTG